MATTFTSHIQPPFKTIEPRPTSHIFVQISTFTSNIQPPSLVPYRTGICEESIPSEDQTKLFFFGRDETVMERWYTMHRGKCGQRLRLFFSAEKWSWVELKGTFGNGLRWGFLEYFSHNRGFITFGLQWILWGQMLEIPRNNYFCFPTCPPRTLEICRTKKWQSYSADVK